MKNKKNIIITIIIIVLLLAIGGLVAWKILNKEDEETQRVVDELFANKSVDVAAADLLSQQAQIDEEIQGYIDDTQYSFNNPKIILNPYKISPLTALVIFQTSESTSIKVTINNEDVTTTNNTTKHAIPIYGLYAGTDNKIKLTNSAGETKEFTITTEKYEDKTLKISKADSSLNNDMYFLSGAEGTIMKAFDKNGNIRWYLTTMFSNDIEFLSNGHILVSNGNPGTKSQTYSGMVEIDYLGKIYKFYNLKSGYHHEANELSNGDIIVASSNPNTDAMGDYIVIIDPDTGKEKSFLDLYKIVKAIDSEFASTLEYDWAWNNSIYYDEETKEIILSLRGRNSVISLNYETGQINWIFGNISNWSSAFEKYILQLGPNTRYPNGQHSAFITKEGYLGVFNNDYDPNQEDLLGPELSNYTNNYSSANLYQIDTINKQITQVWEYNDNQSLFSFAISNFQILENGNKLIDFGWEFTDQAYADNRSIREYTGVTYARIIEMDQSDNILFDATIDYGQYRAFKNTFYEPTTNNLVPTRYNALDNTPASEFEVVKTSSIAESLKTAEENTYQFNISRSMFSIDMFILDSDEISIILVGKGEDTYIFKYKESGLQENAHVNINLTGDYAIYLQINGKYYDTERIVKF